MMTNWNPAKWKSGRKLSATLYFSAKTAEAPAAGVRFDKIFACSTKNYHATIEYLLATISVPTFSFPMHFYYWYFWFSPIVQKIKWIEKKNSLINA